MSYTVSPISLAASPNVHSGTGTFSDNRWQVDPSSVSGSDPMTFSGRAVRVTTMLFEIADAVVPNWFGVAIPHGLQDFTRPHIFFHPTPAQAGYRDSQYAAKAGKWPQLFYYMERLGYQLDGAGRNQIIVMPFLTEGATDTGIFAANWLDIVTAILNQARAIHLPSGTSPLTISEVAVSSFSAGIIYSDAFRKHAPTLPSVLDEVWDLDGNASTFRNLSKALIATAGCRVIQYDQAVSNDTTRFHVPLARWAKLVQPPKTPSDVHGEIRDFMFMHGASISEAGGLIDRSGSAADTDDTASTMTFSGTDTSTYPPAPPRRLPLLVPLRTPVPLHKPPLHLPPLNVPRGPLAPPTFIPRLPFEPPPRIVPRIPIEPPPTLVPHAPFEPPPLHTFSPPASTHVYALSMPIAAPVSVPTPVRTPFPMPMPIPMPAPRPDVASAHASACVCNCAQVVVATTANVLVVTQAALTAITAIAALNRSGNKGARW